MSDAAPPADADGVAGRRTGSLSGPDIDRILDQFRAWLESLNDAPDSPDDEAPFELAALVGAFTALRHDVNLQTKAARVQSEQTASALDLLHNVVDRLDDRPGSDNSAADALLVSLIEAADALARAAQAFERALATPAPTGLRRWFRSSKSVDAMRATLVAGAEGLTLAAQRLDRALEKHGLESIPAVGEQFDPETMEALDVVVEPGRRANEVVEEVRRGYVRDGRVFRSALVKVVK